MKQYFVYILANWDTSVIYIGVTNNLECRLYEHKTPKIKGFTARYKTNKLVYLEETSDITAASAREKQLKSWRREKKNALVATTNSEWKDLSSGT